MIDAICVRHVPVLITGGTGMIGANLAYRLVAGGARVTVLASGATSAYRLQTIRTRIRIATADVRDASAVRAAIEQSDPAIVYHLAGTSFNPPAIPAHTHFEVIVMGTLNVLNALVDRPGVTFISAGSAAEYGSGSGLREDSPLRPGTVLGAAKAAATTLVQTYSRLHGMNAVVLRVFTPYGPWEHPRRLIPHTILSALQGRDVLISGGGQQRDYFHVDDLIDGLLLAAAVATHSGTTFNLCSGRGISVREIAQMVLDVMRSPARLIAGPEPRRDEIWELSGDNSLAAQVLGWRPRISLTDGLRNTVEWFKQHRAFVEALA